MLVVETPIEKKRRERREEYYRNYDWYRSYAKRYTARRKELAEQYYKDSSTEQRMFVSARNRAKKNNIDFNLSIEDIIIPDVCPLLGIELRSNKYGKKPTPNSPTLDRKDSTLGYTKENIWVVSHKANRAKNNLSIEELELLVTNMRRHSE